MQQIICVTEASRAFAMRRVWGCGFHIDGPRPLTRLDIAHAIVVKVDDESFRRSGFAEKRYYLVSRRFRGVTAEGVRALIFLRVRSRKNWLNLAGAGDGGDVRPELTATRRCSRRHGYPRQSGCW